MIFAAWLPSLAIVPVVLYEEDPIAVLHGSDTTFKLFAKAGRLAWYPLHLVTHGRFPYPEASYALSTVYAAVVALWLVAMANALLRVTRSWTLACYTASFIALLPVSWEGRFWNGHWSLTAQAIQMGVFAILARPSHVGLMKRRGARVGLAATSTFVAMNTHQAGAFVMVGMLGLLAASIVVRSRKLSGPEGVAWIMMAAGFVFGALIYTAEFIMLKSLFGFQTRSNGMPLQNMANFLSALGAVSVPGIAPHPALWHWAVTICLLIPMGIAAFGNRRIGWVRKWSAILLVVFGALGAAVPVVVADGFMSCRVLLPAVIAVWGGNALFCARRCCVRLPVWMWTLPWIAQCVLHLWGFGLLATIKADAWRQATALRAGLARAGAQSGNIVVFTERPLSPWPVTIADLGRGALQAPWGTAETVASPEPFPVSPQPVGLNAVRDQSMSAPPDSPRGPVRTGRAKFLVDGTATGARALWIESLFVSPFARSHALDYRRLYPESNMWVQESTSGTVAFRRGGQLIATSSVTTGPIRLYLPLPHENGRWRLECAVEAVAGTAGVHDAVPARLRLGYRTLEGNDGILAEGAILTGSQPTAMTAAPPPSAGFAGYPWVEVEVPPEVGHGLRRWALIHRLELLLEEKRRKTPLRNN